MNKIKKKVFLICIICIENRMSLKDELKTTPRYVQILAQNGITTMKDFFNYFPRTYEDRSKIAPLDSLIFDAK